MLYIQRAQPGFCQQVAFVSCAVRYNNYDNDNDNNNNDTNNHNNNDITTTTTSTVDFRNFIVFCWAETLAH